MSFVWDQQPEQVSLPGSSSCHCVGVVVTGAADEQHTMQVCA